MLTWRSLAGSSFRNVLVHSSVVVHFVAFSYIHLVHPPLPSGRAPATTCEKRHNYGQIYARNLTSPGGERLPYQLVVMSKWCY